MKEKKVRYPIGDQDFKSVREGGFLYVDKTRYIETLTEGNKYYFLARPRRFGKSLFLSTLRYFFEGRRELFEGLYIASTEWNWESYPVLHLDLNTDQYAESGKLQSVLDRLLRGWEERYGVNVKDTDYSQRFRTIIETAHEKTGKPVVILVDEYDKPLVSNLNEEYNFGHYRSELAAIYSNFKSAAEHIRLVMITGVSRFSKLSVFSALNNIQDITFSDSYADICGITEKELYDYFEEGITLLAQRYRMSYEVMCKRLKKNYDGYCFSPLGSDIYNPWSVLNAMNESRIGGYWNATGAASVIARTLHASDVDVEKILTAQWKLEDLAGLDLLNADPTALLYQTGYLTISHYNIRRDTVRLKVPNNEVKQGLFNDLLGYYVKVSRGTTQSVVRELINHIEEGDPEGMMQCLDAYFSGIPYDMKLDNENNFHNAFYILMTLIGIDARTEVHTCNGRIDLQIVTEDFIYIIELKYDSNPEEALRQIEEKGYADKFARDSRKLYKIGVSFSSKKRRIEGWDIKS